LEACSLDALHLCFCKNSLDLRFVIHTGDVVNWPAYDPAQLPIASEAMAVLDNAGIPSQLSIGNHDTAAVNWAKGVVESHPDYNVIIHTHSYLTSTGGIYQSNGGYGSNSPQYVYDNLVKLYPNIKFVFCGHTGIAAKREDIGVHGNKIVSINGTFHSNTNNPVQLLEIDVNNGTASTKFYVPLDGYEWTQYRWTFSGLNFVSPSSTPTYLLDEGFNSEPDGAVPANWILNTSGGTVTVQPVPSAQEKSMRLQKFNSPGYAAAMKKFAPQTSGIITYGAWVLSAESSSTKQIMVRSYDLGEMLFAISPGYTGTFYVSDIKVSK